MAKELVLKANIKREEGYLYYISAKGDVMRVKMSRKGRKRGATNK